MSISTFGGLLAFLVLIHLVADWLLQTDWIAARKTTVWWVRAGHVLLYTACFVWWVSIPWLCWIASTHYVIDSYKPLLWFRKLTRDPSAKTIEAFKEAFNTPRGFVVCVTY